MSAPTPGKTKSIRDSFTYEQPGQINVAGEVFFLNLDGQKVGSVTEKLFDDSVKGDDAFQLLFLGGVPKGPTNPEGLFTQQQQVILRRIFRAIFGVTVTKKKKGPGAGVPLPCSKEDRELLGKSLEIRRRFLIEQIVSYEKTGSSDIHARYLRDHLFALNRLIDDEIPKSKARCVFTGVIDPTRPQPLQLDDDRMRRLLEIFAYLLAQGKDPITSLAGQLPKASEVLPLMAQPDAPDIYDYDRLFKEERSGKVPEYTETLKKIRRVLEDTGVDNVVVNEDLTKLIEEIENTLRLPHTGTYQQRQTAVREKLTALLTEIDEANRKINLLQNEKAKLMKELADLKIAKEDCDKQLAALRTSPPYATYVRKSEYDALEAKKKELDAQIAARIKDIEAKDKIIAELTAKVKELDELKAKKAALDTEIADLKEQLTALRTKCEADLADLRARVEKLTRQVTDLTGERDTFRDQVAARDVTIGELRAQIASLNEALAARPDAAAFNTLRDEATRLRNRVAELQPLADQVPVLQGQLTEMTNDRNRLRDLYNALIAVAGPDGLTPERLQELINTAGTVPGLTTQLEAARTAAATATDDLATARARILELEAEIGRRPAAADLETLRGQLAAAIAASDRAAGERDNALEQVRRLTTELADARIENERLSGERDAAATATAAANERARVVGEQLATAQARILELEAEIGRRPTPANLTELTDQLAAAREEANTLRGQLEAAREEANGLRGQVDRFRTLLERINALLRSKDLPEIPADLNDDSVAESLRRLQGKLNTPPPPPPLPPLENPNITLCLLNILYGLVKKVYTAHGTPWFGSTDTSKYVNLFRKIESKAETLPAFNEEPTFFLGKALTKLSQQAPTAEGIPFVQGPEDIAKYEQYYPRIVASIGDFSKMDRDSASYILRDYIPKYADFVRFVITAPEERKIKTQPVYAPTNTDVASLFILCLIQTKQILNTNRAILESSGCLINS